ncbi:MAG TPA: acetyl-CoA C-acyltransferase [Acholeplasmataceae bacterium]|nr:MAG: acetyl-CoA acetyltransferase [Tenericutes bacterium GWA2_38_26]OHE31647.1 MAG: acetyl-CoA acetyltransferase [Tenericutes bacterium GWD2_38_27]OHE39392.1 MAG: acetyl-CoA acetyltransferase [Tenericutes bacterium GWE2_38_8]HBG32575.1 acetyl-CoA C-acyltransferase [Acholeplasmataceae bacterium]HBY65565.1 acetyl-CoA C-acyltransferase [Acholeplasmataceae bacterium]
MSKVYIVSAKRTAIGSFLGALSTVSPSEFGAKVVKSILEETKIDPSVIDEVISGNILPAGQGQGIGRQVAIKAGIPFSVPGYAVSMVCGSGMKAIMDGYLKIVSGWSHIVIAGGTESMSQAPHLLPSKARSGVKMGNYEVVDHMIYDALIDAYDGIHMGITAENIAEKHSISREEQDLFAYDSQVKAIKSVDEGRFDEEVVGIEVKVGKEVVLFNKDEYPNRKTSLEKLATLKPAFKKDGSVTAGNASGINDGAAYVLLASEEAVQKYHLQPLVEIVGADQAGVDPKFMGLGPVNAIKNVLNRTNLKLSSIELIELNEAFAAQSIGVMKELSQDLKVPYDWFSDRTNVNGGAIALGHPVGCSGARIVVSLTHELKKRNQKLGLASLCIGGGMGTAIIIKNVE